MTQRQYSKSEIAGLQKRIIKVIVISQVFAGFGLSAGITVGALVAKDLLNSDSLSGVPIALFILGSALSVYFIGKSVEKYGRRLPLSLGFVIGGSGAILVVFALIFRSIPLLIVGMFIYGAGSATNLQARYAVTDLALPQGRGKAVSYAMVSTTVGALIGPNITGFLEKTAQSIGLSGLSGIFIFAGFVYLCAGFVLFFFLKPDPYFIAQSISKDKEELVSKNKKSYMNPGLYIAATVMVLTQVAMVAIMAMTPVHMRIHHHGLGAIGLVISVHIAMMYLPSLITGRLVDSLGTQKVAMISAFTLLCAGVLAALAPAESVLLLLAALALLGLGWNFGLIAGTTAVVNSTSQANRAKVQGNVDVLVSLSGAAGGLGSGLVMASTSYSTLSLIGGCLSLVFIPMLVWSKKTF